MRRVLAGRFREKRAAAGLQAPDVSRRRSARARAPFHLVLFVTRRGRIKRRFRQRARSFGSYSRYFGEALLLPRSAIGSRAQAVQLRKSTIIAHPQRQIARARAEIRGADSPRERSPARRSESRDNVMKVRLTRAQWKLANATERQMPPRRTGTPRRMYRNTRSRRDIWRAREIPRRKPEYLFATLFRGISHVLRHVGGIACRGDRCHCLLFVPRLVI